MDPIAALPHDRGAVRGDGGIGRPGVAQPVPSHQWVPGGQDDPESPACRRRRGVGAALVRILPADRYHSRAAKPVRLPGRDSEPEPDRCIALGMLFDYADHHPGPGEIAVIMEIADSSLAVDRKLATEVYGPAGIPVYWIVNLIQRQVEVYTDPSPLGYRSSEVVAEGQSVPVVIDGQPVGWIAVSDILPPRPADPKAGE